jgi:hypothetical protein
MKGWIAAVLAVTFLSGTSTGYLLGCKAEREAVPTNADRYVEQLERFGVTKQEDLDKARAIYEEWEDRVRAQVAQVRPLLKDPLEALDKEYSRQIQEIIDSYKSPDKRK